VQVKFTIDHELLAETVAQVARVLPQSPVSPVLTGVLLRAAGDAAQMSAFDYEVSCLGRVPADVAEEGTALVPGRLLAEITRRLPGKPAELRADGTRMTLRCGAATFTLMQLPEREYPALPEMPPPAGTIGSHAFATAVSQVAVAAAKDDTLPALTGILAQIRGEHLTLTATDRYRMAILQTTWAPHRPDLEATILIPWRALADVSRRAAAAAEISIHLASAEDPGPGDGTAGFEAGGWQSTTRLLAGEYPRVEPHIPSEFSCAAEVPVARFTEAIKRVALVAERNTPVRVTFSKGTARLEAGEGDEAQASEELDITFDDADFEIRFNPSYLSDALNATGTDTARIYLTTPTKAALITAAGDDDRYRHIIMPIRNAG
jgi:DNA polymerase III subunit beta